MASWILFGLFALVVAINAVVGLVRGLNKSMIRLMMVILSVGLTYLIAGPITTLIADSITVEGQSLGDLILGSINADGSMDMIFTAVPLLPELIKVVPAFVIALVVFPVVFMVIKFTSWVAYLFVHKHLRKLIFGKQPGIDGIIVVIVLVIIAVAILAVVGAKFQSISNDAMTKTESEIAKLWGST